MYQELLFLGPYCGLCTVVPLLKDSLAKGHLPNKGRIFWKQVL